MKLYSKRHKTKQRKQLKQFLFEFCFVPFLFCFIIFLICLCFITFFFHNKGSTSYAKKNNFFGLRPKLVDGLAPKKKKKKKTNKQEDPKSGQKH